MVRYLTQDESRRVDEELLRPAGVFISEQLIELAGLAVATAVHRVYPPKQSVLVVSGPGNNGADGLVAARHLTQFGYQVDVHYPRVKLEHFVAQCKLFGIAFLDEMPSVDEIEQRYSLVLDAVFGFSFSGGVRAPYDTILERMARLQRSKVISVDIPSGWDVEKGDVNGLGLMPAMLVSLTAPKLCAHHFTGIHYLGGRFIPPELAQRYQLNLPQFPNADCVVELPRSQESSSSSSSSS